MKAKKLVLKRYKVLSGFIIILFLPITALLTLLVKIGEGSEWIYDNILYNIVEFIRNTVVRVFKWDEIAITRYKESEDKANQEIDELLTK